MVQQTDLIRAISFAASVTVSGTQIVQLWLATGLGGIGLVFAGRDVADGTSPGDLETQLAVGPEYSDGYQITEVLWELKREPLVMQ